MSNGLTVATASIPAVDSPGRSSVSRTALRRTAFLWQDGVMISATVRALDTIGLLDLTPDGPHELPDTGYLRAAWSCLDGAGWLDVLPAPAWTAAGRGALEHRERYIAGGRFLARFTRTEPDSWDTPWDAETLAAFGAELDAHIRWRATRGLPEMTVTHLDATLAVPALLSLRGTGRLQSPEGDFARLLTLLGWLDDTGAWTEHGRASLEWVDHCGLIGSYLPMLAKLEELFRGELLVVPGDGEWHVQRGINVEASAYAHKRYFADADPIFQEIFSREPRPAFIADMGCGDASWLAHLHELFGDTIRYVGVDISPIALDHARALLQAAGVQDPLLLIGDVSNPDSLRDQLAEHGLAIDDGLHIRSFLDQDRTYLGGPPRADVPGWSSGPYFAPDGRPLGAEELESDLVAHFQRWERHTGKHGMVILESHRVASHVVRRHLGTTHSVAFDTFHGLSHQYVIEHSAFLRCLRLAGLQTVGYQERRYPSAKPYVAVSLNRVIPVQPAPAGDPDAVRHDTWQPGPEYDLADGVGLHHLLYADGDLAHPRSWGAGPTGIVVRDMLHTIEAGIERARPGDVVRALDYGAGTGFASIELSKALVTHRVQERLADRGASFELHVVDIPNNWFAQGFELMRDMPWTRFHALRGPGGDFRTLLDVTSGEQVDAVMANMVFHLLTAKAMRHAARSIAGVLKPGGLLTFSAPDLAPTTEHSLLLHTPNRLLRRYWLEALDSDEPEKLAPALRTAAAGVLPAARSLAQYRADRRILPTPQDSASVAEALAPYFAGAIERRTYEYLAEEIEMAALVPANQGEYLAEITDLEVRESMIRHLMRERVLPELMSGPAGTALGINLEWKLGRFTRSSVI
ncbi:class I SAM-dependent methyltransferase [Catenulispora rubra]|uniref:class I SAM-dependent methyltransferase n=1 Tax=Catenulispora rubra TaxID=280293 RepID=UPI001891F5C9|nr:class I SAM-dependent methyltransferase [Catenulispora rubra]